MQWKPPTIIAILLSTLFFGPGAFGNDKITSSLKRIPQINAGTYVCSDMVNAVNDLRKLGKTNALIALHEYVIDVDRSGGNSMSIHLVCRLLFINPNGWRPLRYGEVSPKVKSDLISKFPLFPLALSDNVPFLIIDGYKSGGWTSDTADACVEKCKDLEIIPADLPEAGYAEAASKLFQTDAFQQLYENSMDRIDMQTNILFQANGSPRYIRRSVSNNE